MSELCDYQTPFCTSSIRVYKKGVIQRLFWESKSLTYVHFFVPFLKYGIPEENMGKKRGTFNTCLQDLSTFLNKDWS